MVINDTNMYVTPISTDLVYLLGYQAKPPEPRNSALNNCFELYIKLDYADREDADFGKDYNGLKVQTLEHRQLFTWHELFLLALP
jgi:hypothetical protein